MVLTHYIKLNLNSIVFGMTSFLIYITDFGKIQIRIDFARAQTLHAKRFYTHVLRRQISIADLDKPNPFERIFVHIKFLYDFKITRTRHWIFVVTFCRSSAVSSQSLCSSSVFNCFRFGVFYVALENESPAQIIRSNKKDRKLLVDT